MKAAQHIPLDPPVVESLPAARYVGLARTYKMNQLGGIPQQWETFTQQHLSRLDPSRLPAAYGIVQEATHDREDVEYMCAVPAGAGLAPGDGLVELHLPAMRVAKFTHKGHISGIGATCNAAFEQGLQTAGLRATGPVDLIEHYGPEFDPRSGFGSVGLWVHVQG